jgi:hypothetical protein
VFCFNAQFAVLGSILVLCLCVVTAEGETCRPKWSIGIYTGTSPATLRDSSAIRNPVLTAADVTDRSAAFVADPFLLRDRRWHLFFEVLDGRTSKGEIGHAESEDGRRWKYDRIVLTEPFHLSYPFVLRDGDDHYLIPESR